MIPFSDYPFAVWAAKQLPAPETQEQTSTSRNAPPEWLHWAKAARPDKLTGVGKAKRLLPC